MLNKWQICFNNDNNYDNDNNDNDNNNNNNNNNNNKPNDIYSAIIYGAKPYARVHFVFSERKSVSAR